jgi:hypothetical protein
MGDVANLIGLCGWPAGVCQDDNYGLVSFEQAAEVEDEAKFILWSFTGSRFGVCSITWSTSPQCSCRIDCLCRGCDLRLPGPVYEVYAVRVDGEPYDDWIVRGDVLVSTTFWPRDVEVDYGRGVPPPFGAGRVVSLLAQQLAYARCDDKRCKLPLNLVQRTRQGDTQRFDLNTSQKIGIPTIDLWVTAANGIRLPARVWSPDVDVPLISVHPTVPGSTS